MYICVTEVDAVTKIVCTQEPQRTGPSMPAVKGLKLEWADKSTWPVELAEDGTYLRAPKYYGTCDDDADTSIAGVLEVLSEADYFQRKQAEYEARRPYPSWLWDEDNGQWIPPIPRPDDAVMNGGNVRYKWDEETVSWMPLNQGQQ
jgi:hypothetical protein